MNLHISQTWVLTNVSIGYNSFAEKKKKRRRERLRNYLASLLLIYNPRGVTRKSNLFLMLCSPPAHSQVQYCHCGPASLLSCVHLRTVCSGCCSADCNVKQVFYGEIIFLMQKAV